MKETILKGTGITKSFEKSGRKSKVLNGIDIEIYKGDFTVIMGSSGAGKSTLLYTLSGMDKLTSGEVSYKNKIISKLNEKATAQLRADEFGFIFQQSNLVSNLTIAENVRVAGYAGRKFTRAEIDDRTNKLFAQMKMTKIMDSLPSEVSGGEAQRTAIARAVISSPDILFADEPTGALNKSNSESVIDLLYELNQSGQSILMVTHDVRIAMYGNRILYLEDGRVIDELNLTQLDKTNLKERESALNSWLSELHW